MSQDVSAANLLVKRELLNTQKPLLDQVYETTRSEMAGLPESSHREAIEAPSRGKEGNPAGTVYCDARDVAAAKAVIATPGVCRIYGRGARCN